MAGTHPTPSEYKISVPGHVLSDLRSRLQNTRWSEHIPNAGWVYGTGLDYLQSLTTYWHDHYDWRAEETALNRFEQYLVPLDGIDVHFIHQPGIGPALLPLLLLHGWPTSLADFRHVIPLLANPVDLGADSRDAFTVVAPSLPGHGFSFQPGQPRFGLMEIADTVTRLMTSVLGYDRFGVQGGDWGAFLASRIGYAYYADQLAHWLREETGYSLVMATKPRTLVCALAGAIESSFWPYYARHHGPWIVPPGEKVNVPTGYAEFPREILTPPRSLAERMYADIHRWTR